MVNLGPRGLPGVCGGGGFRPSRTARPMETRVAVSGFSGGSMLPVVGGCDGDGKVCWIVCSPGGVSSVLPFAAGARSGPAASKAVMAAHSGTRIAYLQWVKPVMDLVMEPVVGLVRVRIPQGIQHCKEMPEKLRRFDAGGCRSSTGPANEP